MPAIITSKEATEGRNIRVHRGAERNNPSYRNVPAALESREATEGRNVTVHRRVESLDPSPVWLKANGPGAHEASAETFPLQGAGGDGCPGGMVS
eukprot:6229512-Pyramimonas_sp.AAC.1